MSRLALSALLVALSVVWAMPSGAARDKPYIADVKSASPDAERAIAGFQLPPGIRGSLWAAEPLLANPVSFSFDERGRCFVAETFRLHQGVTDNREHMNWLDDDLASRTVADRVALYKRHLKGEFPKWEIHSDRVRLIEDTTGKGRADKATVFADGFHHAEDGLGAGVLARKGKVWYTCIPNLWLLQDTKGTGHADVKQSLATGFGVHVAFLGHDLHGLTMGPDGRVYFSSGDRGFNVTTKEGRHLFNPDSGAVLRCEPDGSNLEIVHIGLRNPQELAFDDWGDLFTCDNNSDSGDKARWVMIVEGGDSGWRTGYQYGSDLGDRGPWNAEKLWYLPHEGQPAYIVPPLAHIADGPSGLCYNPGVTGLPQKYAGHFFLCDFRGSPGGSGVWTFEVKPKGAAFELVKREHFVWNLLATDCDFAPDGGLYVSDWVNGWELTGRGRIYKFAEPARLKSAAVQDVKKLLAEGFDQRPIPELVKLLGHADRRVRLEAQFALVAKNALAPLTEVASNRAGGVSPLSRLARLHAIWGLGQLGRKDERDLQALLPLLKDPDPEVRAQSAQVLSDAHGSSWFGPLCDLTRDAAPRVRFFAAASLGRLASQLDDTYQHRAAAALLDMVRRGDDQDPYLRHAIAYAVAGLRENEALKACGDALPGVRLVGALALRRQARPEIARLLNDPIPAIRDAAARAIHDDPIPAALSQLAELLPRGLPEPIALRALNAHFRLGQSANATAVAAYAARADAPPKLRMAAVKMLGDWAKPPRRDYVTGLTQNLPERPVEIARAALRQHLAGIIGGPDRLRATAIPIATRLGLREIVPTLRALLNDAKRPSAVRVAAFRGMTAFQEGRSKEVVERALADRDPQLRIAARQFIARTSPGTALKLLRSALETGTTAEQQAAFTTLGTVREPAARALLAQWLDKLLAGRVPPPLRLDLLEAAGRVKDPSVKERLAKFEAARPKNDHLAAWRETLVGGDASLGQQIFLAKEAVSCVRCHKLHGTGGEVGPPLDGIGGKQTREYLLESIVEPSRQIAKGYESLIISTVDGRVVTGVLKSEDAKAVHLMTAEGKPIVVKKEEIDERRSGPSAMPADLVQHLTKRELRDLVEFLAKLK